MSPKPTTGNPLKKDETVAVSRREFLKLASASGVASATSGFAAFASSAIGSKSNDGTPEQISYHMGERSRDRSRHFLVLAGTLG